MLLRRRQATVPERHHSAACRSYCARRGPGARQGAAAERLPAPITPRDSWWAQDSAPVLSKWFTSVKRLARGLVVPVPGGTRAQTVRGYPITGIALCCAPTGRATAIAALSAARNLRRLFDDLVGAHHDRERDRQTLPALLAAALDKTIYVTANGPRRKLAKREATVAQMVDKSPAPGIRFRRSGTAHPRPSTSRTLRSVPRG
jgi:hypothetical protein